MMTTAETSSGAVEPRYRCDACGTLFRTPEALADHVNSVGLVY
jgi:uncharacterized C2H2 Zn-finger protein